jgi:hypothetical protein
MIGFVAFVLIGLYSLGAVLWGSNFAETHLTVSFLNFPVFISEILMGICLVLCVVKYWREGMVLTKWHKLLLIYWNSLLFKALWDSWTWGPLAFRNAALFTKLALAIEYMLGVKAGVCNASKESCSASFHAPSLIVVLFILSKTKSRYLGS